MPSMPGNEDVGQAYVQARNESRAASALERLQRMAAPVEAVSPSVSPPPASVPVSPPASSPEAGGGFSFGAVARDMTQGLAETLTIDPRHNAILTGIGNAVDELGDSIADLVLYPVGKSHEDLDRLFGTIETPGPQSTTGKLISGVTQFAAGVYMGGKALTAAKLGTVGGPAVQAVARGALGDLIAFDEHDQRLSDLVEQFPALRNPITGYLAADPNDSFVEGKTKQALEGVLGNALAETLFRGVKAYRRYREARALSPAAQADEAIAKVAVTPEVRAAEDGALGLTERDWVALGGDPARPLIEVTETVERRAASLVQGLDQKYGPDSLRDMLATLRTPSRMPRPEGILTFMRRNGGIAPSSEMDLDWRELGKKRPGIVSGKGMAIDAAVERAVAEGYLPARPDMPAASRADELMAAIEREMAGERLYPIGSPEAERKAALDSLQSQIDELGIDLNQPDDAIEAALRRAVQGEAAAKPAGNASAEALDMADNAAAEGFDEAATPRTAADLDAEDAAGRAASLDALVPGRIVVGKTNKVANINLNRIDGPDDLLQVARDVGKMMVEAGEIGPTVTQSTDVARGLADALLEEPETVQKWLSGQSATGRAFSREEIIGAGEVLTKNLASVRALAKKIAAGGASDVDKLALHRAMALQQSMMKLVSQQSREAGRALQAFRTTVAGNKAAAEAIRNILAHEGNTERMAAMINALDQPGQANRFIKGVVEGGSMWGRAGDALLEVFFNSILSGPRTHLINMLGNTMNAMSAVAERAVGARMPGATIPKGEAAEMLFGTLRGFKDGLVVARQAWRTGLPGDAAAKVEILKRRAITAERFGIDQLTGPGAYLARGVDLLGEAIRIPGRALMTADEFFKTVARRQQLSALAYRRAVAEGHDGQALAARIHDLIASPTPDMVDDAASFAAYQTFTSPLGTTGRMGQMFLGRNKWMRLIVPFVQTPVNVLKYATERSPFGLLMKSVRDDIAAGGVRRDLAMAKIGLGSMVMATAADFAAQGVVTGAPPGDPGQRQAWEREGRLPYAIRLGDRWVQYNRLDPVGMTIGIAADLAGIMDSWADAEGLELSGPRLEEVRQSLRENWGLSEEEVQQAVDRLSLERQQGGRITPERVMGAVVTAFKENLLNKSYLSGIADLSGALEAPSPEQSADGVARWLQRTALGFVPYSAAMRTAEQVMDPTLRDAATLVEALRSMTPGASASLPPLVDLWGQPRQTALGLSPVATREEAGSPIDQEMIRLRMSVTMPGKDIKGVRMTPEEYVRFAQLAGNGLKDPVTGLGAKETLDAMVTGTHPNEAWNEMYRQASDGPDGGKALLIRTVIEEFREAARGQLLQENRALAGALQENERLKNEAINNPPRL